MRNNIIKILAITLIAIIIMSLMIINISNAGLTDPLENPEHYNPETNIDVSNNKLVNKTNVIINAIQIIGTVIAVISIMAIGLKYMFGSVTERATYKETMLPYLIGAIMLFSIVNIIKIFYEIIRSSIYI